MGNSPKGRRDPAAINTDADRHLSPAAALRKMAQEVEFEASTFESLTIECSAAGELTWRLREPRAEENQIGYLPPD